MGKIERRLIRQNEIETRTTAQRREEGERTEQLREAEARRTIKKEAAQLLRRLETSGQPGADLIEVTGRLGRKIPRAVWKVAQYQSDGERRTVYLGANGQFYNGSASVEISRLPVPRSVLAGIHAIQRRLDRDEALAVAVGKNPEYEPTVTSQAQMDEVRLLLKSATTLEAFSSAFARLAAALMVPTNEIISLAAQPLEAVRCWRIDYNAISRANVPMGGGEATIGHIGPFPITKYIAPTHSEEVVRKIPRRLFISRDGQWWILGAEPSNSRRSSRGMAPMVTRHATGVLLIDSCYTAENVGTDASLELITADLHDQARYLLWGPNPS